MHLTRIVSALSSDLIVSVINVSSESIPGRVLQAQEVVVESKFVKSGKSRKRGRLL